jgi:hypothetical protein
MFGAVSKLNREFPVINGAQLLNAVSPHNAGTMDAKKSCRVKPLF